MDNSTPHSAPPKLGRLLIYFILLVIGIGVGVLSTKTQGTSENKQTVTVIGNGIIEVPANQAVIYAKTSVISRDKGQAAFDNNKRMQDLKKALLDSDVSEDSINISTYVDPVYDYSGYDALPTGSASGTLSSPSSPTGEYNANSSFTITLDNINVAKKVEDVIQNTPNAELNGSPSYVLKDATPYESEAREKALLDARSQADKIAQINNLKVGKVLSVVDQKTASSKEQENYYPSPYIKSYADFGEKTVRVTASYTVKYELTNRLLPL